MTAIKAPAEPEKFSVALSFEDGVTRFITCRDDQTVADASYRQRINIPLDCRDGACGTCKAMCESGDYDGGTYIDDALSVDEAARGYVLPCSMKPRSDLVLQIASTSDIAKTQAATFTGTLVGVDPAVGHHRAVRRRDPQPLRTGVPAGAVRQHHGARNRSDSFLFLLQRTARGPAHLPGEAHPRRPDVGLPGPARGCRRPDHVHRTARVVLPPRGRTPGAHAGGRDRPGARSWPCCARCAPTAAGARCT